MEEISQDLIHGLTQFEKTLKYRKQEINKEIEIIAQAKKILTHASSQSEESKQIPFWLKKGPQFKEAVAFRKYIQEVLKDLGPSYPKEIYAELEKKNLLLFENGEKRSIYNVRNFLIRDAKRNNVLKDSEGRYILPPTELHYKFTGLSEDMPETIEEFWDMVEQDEERAIRSIYTLTDKTECAVCASEIINTDALEERLQEHYELEELSDVFAKISNSELPECDFEYNFLCPYHGEEKRQPK